MAIILCNDKSALTIKITSILKNKYSIHFYDDEININNEDIIITIEENLSKYQENILDKIRKSTYVIGVWAKDTSRSYLPKELEDLFDSIICEENIPQLNSLLETKRILLQTPDCSELKIKELIRVNCKTGKKLK